MGLAIGSFLDRFVLLSPGAVYMELRFDGRAEPALQTLGRRGRYRWYFRCPVERSNCTGLAVDGGPPTGSGEMVVEKFWPIDGVDCDAYHQARWKKPNNFAKLGSSDLLTLSKWPRKAWAGALFISASGMASARCLRIRVGFFFIAVTCSTAVAM